MTLSLSSLWLLHSKYETFLPAFVQVPQNNWLRFKYFYIFFWESSERSVLKFTFIHFGEVQRHERQENRYDCFHWWKISPAACDWSPNYFSLVIKTVRPIGICAVYHFRRQFPWSKSQHVSLIKYIAFFKHIRHCCYCLCNLVSTTCEGTK